MYYERIQLLRKCALPSAALWISLAILLGGWFVAAVSLHSRSLPTPLTVLLFVVHESASGELPFHLAMTLMRVCAAFFISMVIGSAIGIALGLHRKVDRLFDPWLILFLNIPALVTIVLAYVWFGLTEAAAIGAVSMSKIPNVIVTMREGARSLDRDYGEMAVVFRFSGMKTIRHVILPQLQPFFATATRSGLALIWKIVLLVELLGRSNGVGFQIHLYFQYFDVAAIIGYTLSFVGVMLMVEFLLLQPYERRIRQWRLPGA